MSKCHVPFTFRYKKYDTDLLDICSFVDPRVKSLAHLSSERRLAVQQMVLTAIKVDEQHSGELSASAQLNPTPTSGGSTSRTSVLSSLLGSFSEQANCDSQSPSDQAEIQLRSYIHDTPCAMDGVPLDW